jgi:hypothetical protein
MKKEKPSLKEYFKFPNPGLWAYFKHTESGQPDDYRPPFWNKMDRSKVLELWQKRMDQLKVEEKYPSLYSYEMEMKGKVGPLSIQLPLKERIDSIEQYYTAIDTSSEPINSDAIQATVNFFKKAGGIRLRSIPKTILNMRLNTNSGTPFFTKRKNVLDDTIKSKFTSVPTTGEVWQDTEHGNYKLAAILGWRGQEGGISSEDVKQRVVWMMPFLLNIRELQFYQPAVEAVQKYGLIPAYVSMDAVDQEVTSLFDTKGKDDLVICTDFSKFDQHFNMDMQNAAQTILKALGSKNDELISYWMSDIYPIKYNIPLICSEGLMYTGHHGMGSGSGGTNFDECMAHKALQFEAALSKGQQLNSHSMAYGDDGILTYPGITVEDVIQTYTKHGQEMNATKQYVSKHDCVVLRRWHGDNYRVNGIMVGVYSTFRALGRLLGQERFYDPDKWGPEMVTLRALSILENCKWSPVFHEFIDFVISGDKYRLGLNIPHFFDRLEKTAKEAIDTFTDFLGYTKTLQEDSRASVKGINDWEVVKYLKTLR